ncbi:MAG: MmgE/PrpD family protein, partial [Acetobacterales bacterium]
MSDPRRRTVEGTRALLDWAAGLRLVDIPARVLRKAALVVGDNIAAAVSVADQPEVRFVQQQVAATGGRAEATVFDGRGTRTDRYSACLANTVACSWPELDEGYSVASCHGGLYVFGPSIAEAEAEGLTVGDVVRAVAVGYEVAARVARTWTFPRFTVHPHAAYSAIGGAAATAALRGLDGAGFHRAATAAATMAGTGSYNHGIHGGLVRNVWAAQGAWTGMRCADWAPGGISGLPDSLYEVYTEAFGVEPKPDQLSDGLGDAFAIMDGFHKIHACCQSAHTAVDAALVLVGTLSEKGTAAIERIVIDTPRLEMDNKAPANTLAAKFSIPQIVAATLFYGHCGAEAFTDASLSEPEIVRLRNAIELKPWGPADPHAR